MFVVATAGHVDHGKSTLVRALTGMEPDRWAEERRRGLTIDLGFAWTELRPGMMVAFVDVPGHERFVPNMLAGVGPVPAALVVVAADEGWMPQSAEHLAALDALDVRHGLCVITRSDLADPEPARRQALAEIARTSLGEVEGVPVGGLAGTGQAFLGGVERAGGLAGAGRGLGGEAERAAGGGLAGAGRALPGAGVGGLAGTGLSELRDALGRLLDRLPAPAVSAPVRLWIDRCFTIRGSGTVVTGTLAAGRLRVGDELEIASSGRVVGVRGLQSLGRAVSEVDAVARIAVNLRGVERHQLRRGDALLAPQRFCSTGTIDVRVHGDPVAVLPESVMLHVGSAAVAVRVRPLGGDTARLTLDRPLPLRIGDRCLLRDPGQHRISGGCTVLDVAPPALNRRRAAASRAVVLAGLTGRADEHSELRRRGIARRGDLERMGVATSSRPLAGDWLVEQAELARLRAELPRFVAAWHQEHPLESGPPVDVVRQALRLPDRALVHALLAPPLTTRAGRIVHTGASDVLPAPVIGALEQLQADLAAQPFVAPLAERLAELGLGPRELAAAVRVGVLTQLAEGVVLLPGSIQAAATTLAALPQPFTVSEARKALGTTRRVAVPLLELLDRKGVTVRLPDDRRRMR